MKDTLNRAKRVTVFPIGMDTFTSLRAQGNDLEQARDELVLSLMFASMRTPALMAAGLQWEMLSRNDLRHLEQEHQAHLRQRPTAPDKRRPK